MALACVVDRGMIDFYRWNTWKRIATRADAGTRRPAVHCLAIEQQGTWAMDENTLEGGLRQGLGRAEHSIGDAYGDFGMSLGTADGLFAILPQLAGSLAPLSNGFIVDVGKSVKPFVSPDDPDAFEVVLRERAGLRPESQSGPAPLL